MASNRVKNPEEEEERKIPVFTVLRNGAILKNIFVINKSPLPSPTSSETSTENEKNPVQETEEILTFGRHPDCNIVLNHPSISRFHLQINSKPSSQKLFVTDLSSVHGTWVSGKKIEPGFRVELTEGDMISVGGSTRVYRLHWVPLSHAYDMESPFISPSDVAMIEEKQEENSKLKEENEMKMSQDEDTLATEIIPAEVKLTLDENLLATEREAVAEKDSLTVTEKEDKHEAMDSISVENRETQPLDLILQDIVSLYFDEICESIAKKKIYSPALVPNESMNSLFYDAKEDIEDLFRNDHEVRDILSPSAVQGIISETKSQQFDGHSQSPGYYSVQQELPDTEITDSSMIRQSKAFSSLSAAEVEAHSASEVQEATENGSLLRKDHEQKDISLPEIDLPENESQKVHKVNQTLVHLVDLQPKNEEGNQENFSANLLVNLNSACLDDHPDTDMLELGSPSFSRDDHGQSEYTTVSSSLLAAESVNSSLPVGVPSGIVGKKMCQTPESVFASIENQENLQSSRVRSEKQLNSYNIWSRRGKPNAVLQLHTSRSKGKNRVADTEWGNEKNAEDRSISKTSFSGLEAAEEILTPGKKNYSPNTLLLRSLKKKGTQLSNSCRIPFSQTTFSPNKQLEEDMIASSDKENQTPKVLQQRKSALAASKNQVKFKQEMKLKESRVERVPLQSLLSNFSGTSTSDISVPNDATRSSTSVNCSQIMQKSKFAEVAKRRWTMVADTSSLLDRESRKSLQLLQGLKGTHLVIPKMVIRELDCLQHRGSLFRRKTEASLVLEWIEECMVRTPWWIHVQSSMEEGRQIAPTPPASPQSRFSQGTEGFSCGTGRSVAFSARGSILDIVSPTAEDHILEYALSHRKKNRDGQLILLSNDVILKIKAMAEGLICEAANEFRDSLANPFSERFLWAESSPRGLTWSVLDDLVLKERYYRSPSKKSSKGEGAKGLKLILLHNSQYGQIKSVS